MKLEESKVTVTSSHAQKERLGFEIEDMGQIISMLRSNIYSDPIGSICREIACNSRDAHREAGCPERPINITMPNMDDDNIIFRDFGIGITPQRMDRVYRKYGNSTKRDSNVATGGWGIGAKTPFAYSNQFSVVSITKIDSEEEYTTHPSSAWDKTIEEYIGKPFSEVQGKHLRCLYVNQISQDNSGQINLISVSLTDEETGVAVYIGVKHSDRRKFAEKIVYATECWDVRPNILGDIINYPDPQKVLVEGDGWKVFSYNRNRTIESYVVLDGIRYPINLDMIAHKESSFLRHSIAFVLVFNTGELQVTGSRENLSYQEEHNTIKNLTDRINKMLSEMEANFREQINACESYRQAYIMARQFNELRYLGDITWNGIKVRTTDIDFNAHQLNARLDFFERGRKSKSSYVSIREQLVINDIGKIVPSAAVDALKEKFNTFQILTSRDNDMPALLEILKQNAEMDLSLLKPVKMSEFIDVTTGKKRVTGNNAFKLVKNKWTSVAVDLTKESGYYVVLLEYKRKPRFASNLEHDISGYVSNYRHLVSNANPLPDLFAFKPDQVKDLGANWIPLEDKLKEVKDELEAQFTLEDIRKAYNTNRHLSYSSGSNAYSCMKGVFPNHPLISEISNKFKLISAVSDKNQNKLYEIYRFLGLKIPDDSDIDKDTIDMLNQLNKMYPLLDGHTQRNLVIDYVTMVDEYKAFKKSMQKAS